MTKTHTELVEYYESWYENAKENGTIKIAEICDDYYHNQQWTKAQEKDVESRGQPVVTYNVLASQLNKVVGQEIASRVDPRAFPRTKVRPEDAKVATDALRYVSDKDESNRDAIKTKMAFDMGRVGWGGSLWSTRVVGPKPQEDAPETREIEIICTHVLWDRLFWDPHTRLTDFEDSKFLGLALWMDMADAKAQFLDAGDVFSPHTDQQRGVGEQHRDTPENIWFDSKRDRVKVVEIYWWEIKEGSGRIWYTAKFTLSGMVEDPAPCAYMTPGTNGEHWCPLQMQAAHIDRHGLIYGVLWSLLDPQREINFRRSKALHAINTKLVLAEEGTVKNKKTAKIELKKSDGWVDLTPKALTEDKFVVKENSEVAAGNLQLLADAKEMAQALSPGVQSTPNPAGTSGRAALHASAEASLDLKPFMDGLNKWEMRWYRGAWWNVVQYWTYEKWFRVEDSNTTDGYRFVGINRVMTREQKFQELLQQQVPPPAALGMVLPPELADQVMQQAAQQEQQMQHQTQAAMQAAQQGQISSEQVPQPPPPGAVLMQMIGQMPAMKEQVKSSDIGALDVDIVLDVSPNSAIIEHEEYKEMMGLNRELMAGGQQGFPLDVIVEASSLRNKGKILEMLRKPPDPAQVQKQQQAEQMQLQRSQAELARLMAEIKLTQASAEKTSVETQALMVKTPAEVDKLESEATENQAEAMKDAADAGATSAGE